MRNGTPGNTALRALVLGAVLGTLTAASAATAQDRALTLHEWSDAVWASARQGDSDALERYFSLKPEGFDNDRLAVIRHGLDRYQTNRELAVTEREAEQTRALEELREHLEAGDLSQSLRSAVEYQTLSTDYDEALATDQVRDVINRARVAIPQAEADRDWLYAQELVFRLRTLYDDTSERGMYNKYDKQLKDINHRVAMLQLYAPERLHDLRNALAERLGEEPLPAFNAEAATDWQERVDGITSSMVKVALRATAHEHIEARGNEGWRPLLQGGLSSLRTLVTTRELDETFPGLGDAVAVDAFVDVIDDQSRHLAATPDARLQYRHLDALLGKLQDTNSETVGLPREVLLREFADGAMFELSASKEDDYSAIIWPDEIRRFRQQTEGNFVGVGIIIRYNERRDIVVANPLEGTPAFRAGIRDGDVIVGVDGKPTSGWTLNTAVDKITGEEGTEVTLNVRREVEDEWKDLDFTIVRDQINLPSVKGWYKTHLDDNGQPVWDWMIDPVNNIGYVRLTSFAENTYSDVLAAWEQMQANGVQGLILDLRFNPGGLLDQAQKIANLFVREGHIVSIEGKDLRDRERIPARRRGAIIAERGIPVVVLVNKGSASASEIVSGALQAHESAVIVGTRTWGKGSVQRVFGIAHNAQLKLTTQYYRLPPAPGEARGRLVHKRPSAEEWGVDPDILVDMTPSQIEQALRLRDEADAIAHDEDNERPDVNGLLAEGIDPQLETALLILQAKVAGELVASDQARLRSAQADQTEVR